MIGDLAARATPNGHGGTSTIGQQAWTARRVGERLIQAFRELPDHPVYHEHVRLRIEGASSPDAAQIRNGRRASSRRAIAEAQAIACAS
jgi:hypothetical protein